MPPDFSLSHHRKMPAGERACVILVPFLHPYHLLLLTEVRKLGESSVSGLSPESAGVAESWWGRSPYGFHWATLQEGFYSYC